MSEIFVHGISGEVLPSVCVRQLESCKAVVVSKRFTSLLPEQGPRRIAIAPVRDMLVAVADALQAGDVMVLASGDPLFYGIGRTLLDRFGPEKVNFHPALSAVQLACARFKLPWDDLVLLSLHGREPGSMAGRILPHNKVMLFTDHRNSPDRIAAILLQTLRKYGDEKRQKKIRVRVAENLGTRDEKLTTGSLSEIAETRFGPLNMMLVEQDLPVMNLPVFGLQEGEIIHSRGLITKDEVRAVILHCLRLPARGVFWDVGGGSGSISLEAARLAPELSIFTIEKKQEGQENIRRNIVHYNRYLMHLIAGEAPDALAALPDPNRVFIGGSGGCLAEIIHHCAARLVKGGVLVASAVLKTTAEQAPELMREKGLKVSVRTVHVSRREIPAAKEKQLNPITIITGKK
jgi:precorrin-6Y C5,15-methyltransferase (decarboxylating)